jgi:hypothetical protein
MPRVFPTALFLAALAPLAACESLDEAPPPATPAAQVDPAAAAAAAETTADPAAVDPSGKYASQEYDLGTDPDSYDDADPSALTDFRQTLAPYGAWSDDSTYGTVWTPSPAAVGADFTPYVSAGHWVYDDDYTWVSDYDWGWAPFHYGRWVFIEGRGWSWIPGRVYRGAWVGWGVDDGWGYVGWYPLAPPFFWFGGVAVGYGFGIGPRWSYCPHGEVFSPGLGGRVIAGPAVAGVAARVHPMGSVGGLERGPAPSRLGYSAAQIPHASGASAAGLARAQQFSRPSTATALGAHPATHASSASAMGGAAHPSLTGPGAHAMTPGVQPGAQRKKPLTGGGAAPHVGGGFHGGGFRGGGFHGGGGGHGGGHR